VLRRSASTPQPGFRLQDCHPHGPSHRPGPLLVLDSVHSVRFSLSHQLQLLGPRRRVPNRPPPLGHSAHPFHTLHHQCCSHAACYLFGIDHRQRVSSSSPRPATGVMRSTSRQRHGTCCFFLSLFHSRRHLQGHGQAPRPQPQLGHRDNSGCLHRGRHSSHPRHSRGLLLPISSSLSGFAYWLLVGPGSFVTALVKVSPCHLRYHTHHHRRCSQSQSCRSPCPQVWRSCCQELASGPCSLPRGAWT